MKKMCFLWFFMGFVTITSAQDIAPGQQAQGYLDDKNTTVDYATGIFHYKVPLYTLGDGGFSLPVSLDYTAKGVKTEDRPGLIGYNWTLNTGGVVTRLFPKLSAGELPMKRVFTVTCITCDSRMQSL